MAQTLRSRLRPLKGWFHRMQRLTRDIPKVGLQSALRLVRAEPTGTSPGPTTWPLAIPGLPHPLFIRPGGSDAFVVRQIFTDEEYGQIPSLANPNGWILDCGANIGCATLYFLRQFPLARVLSIEPDPENFALLEKNLAPYGERVQLFQGAIWPTERKLRLEQGTEGGGMEWARQVSAEAGGETQGLPIPHLLDRFGIENVALLKVDIEGAEKDVFSGSPSWLDRVANLVLEIHGEECRQVVMRALQPYQFEQREVGELTYFHQLKRISCEGEVPQERARLS